MTHTIERIRNRAAARVLARCNWERPQNRVTTAGNPNKILTGNCPSIQKPVYKGKQWLNVDSQRCLEFLILGPTDPRHIDCFSLKTGFLFPQVSSKIGFTVQVESISSTAFCSVRSFLHSTYQMSWCFTKANKLIKMNSYDWGLIPRPRKIFLFAFVSRIRLGFKVIIRNT